jgi:hypothetical protein
LGQSHAPLIPVIDTGYQGAETYSHTSTNIDTAWDCSHLELLAATRIQRPYVQIGCCRGRNYHDASAASSGTSRAGAGVASISSRSRCAAPR